jgi:hydrogenase/urease accessory protein HupE
MSRKFGLVSASLAWVLLTAMPASAHLVSTGLGPVYDSVLHFFSSPEYLTPVVGLALFAGLRGPDHARWALFLVSGGCLASQCLIRTPARDSVTSLLTSSACLVLGSLVAADLKTPQAFTVALAAAVGLLEGAIDTEVAGTTNSLSGQLGVCAAIFILTALIVSLVIPLRALWLRIAVRVTGSWLAAMGLLLIGWAIRSRSL